MQTDKTTTESKQPLYKVLNEDRTQGKWQVSKYPAIGYPNVIKSEFTSSHIALMGLPTEGEDNTVEAEANAQYTALAVNNLHHLAEALRQAGGRIETLLSVFTNWNAARDDKPYTNILDVLFAADKDIKEALNRIS